MRLHDIDFEINLSLLFIGCLVKRYWLNMDENLYAIDVRIVPVPCIAFRFVFSRYLEE